MVCITEIQNGCKIVVSNPADELEFRANPPVPCYYAEWWRWRDAARRGGTWGGQEILDALRSLRADHDYPREQMERWLAVTNYDPFTIELTLPLGVD